MVAAALEGIGAALDGIGEVGVRQVGDKHRHNGRAARAQTGRKSIEHIAGLGDRSFDWTIQVVPWLGMVSGALCGAILGGLLQSAALWVVAGSIYLTAFATLAIPRQIDRDIEVALLRERIEQAASAVGIERVAPIVRVDRANPMR